mgnify:CR=1 FL=1
MAKFCVYCGRPLQDGEVCDCRNQTPRQAPPVSGEAQAASGEAQAALSAAAAAGQSYLARLWGLIRDIFRAPDPVLGSFAASGDSGMAWGLLAVRSVSFALLLTAFCSRVSRALLNLVKAFSYSAAASDEVKGFLQFPLAKVFFLALIFSFGLSCLLAAILLLLYKPFFRAETTYRRMLCVAGAQSIAAVPFLLAGTLLLFVNMRLGIGAALLAVLLQPVFTLLALEGAAGSAVRGKAVYAVLCSLALFAVCALIVARLSYPLYLPEDLKNAMEQLKSALGNIRDLPGWISGLFGGGFGSAPKSGSGLFG